MPKVIDLSPRVLRGGIFYENKREYSRLKTGEYVNYCLILQVSIY